MLLLQKCRKQTTLLFSLLLAFSAQAQNLSNCLILDLPFDNSFVDQGPNSFSAVPSSSVFFTTDRFGNSNSAINLDGSNDYITLNGDTAIITGPTFSVSTWIKVIGNGGGNLGQSTIFSQRGNTTSLPTYIIMQARNNNNLVKYNIQRDGTSTNYDMTAPNTGFGGWHHYAITVSNDSLVGFIDGQSIGAVAKLPGGTYTNTDYTQIGRHAFSSITQGLLNGDVDEFKIFDCALSRKEVESLFCPVTASISENDTSIHIGDSLTFHSDSTSFGMKWYLNGDSISIDSSVTIQFDSIASDTLVLEVTDGFCTEYDTVFIQTNYPNCLIVDIPFDSSFVDLGPLSFSSTPSSTVFFTQDRFGNPYGALNLDGANDYVTLNSNNPVIVNSEFTISSWVKVIGNGGGTLGQSPIFQQRLNSSSNATLLVMVARNNSDLVNYELKPDGGFGIDEVLNSSIVPFGNWHLYTMVVTNDSIFGYFDGQLFDAVSKFQGGVYLNIDWVNIGRHSFNNLTQGLLNGDVDDFKIFNCPLTPEEVEYLYCPAAASISEGNAIVFLGDSLTFHSENNSYPLNWIYNGDTLSQDSLISIAFDSLGLDTLILESSDGFCSETDTVFVQVLVNGCEPVSSLVDSLKLLCTFENNVIDASWNNELSSFSNLSFVNDRYGNSNQALDFNGSSSFIDTDTTFDFPERTVSIWFNADLIPSGSPTNEDVIFTQNANTLTYGTLKASLLNGELRLLAGGEGVGSTANPFIQSGITSNTWYNLTLVRDGNDVRYYLDGKLIGSALSNTIGSSLFTTDEFQIGRNRDNARHFDGQLDDIRIYNRALSEEEIERLYCPADATILGQSDTIIYDDLEVNLQAACTKYPLTWSINAVTIGNDSVLQDTIDTQGFYIYKLSSTDGFCTDVDSVVIIREPDNCLDPVTLQDSLKLYYPFSNGTLDFSGQNNHGVINGNPTLTTDRYGNPNSAYLFDGIDDFIDTETSYDYEFRTASIWFSPENHNLFRTIFAQDANSLTYGAFSAGIQTNGDLNARAGGNGAFTVLSNTPLNVWTHLALVRTNDSVFHYVNGNLVSAGLANNAGSTSLPNPELVIGVLRTENSNFFDGKLDDVRVYNRALSHEEIERLYCPADATILGQSDTITYEDLEVNLQAACTKYPLTWSVNGLTIGNDSVLQDSIDTAGVYIYKLSSTDGFCTDVDSVAVIREPDNCLDPITLNDSLQLYLPFTGSTADLSGNGMKANPNGGPVLAQDRFGTANSAYLFDGTNDYMALADDYDYPEKTINVWMNADQITSTTGQFYGSDHAGLNYGSTAMRAVQVGSDKIIRYSQGGNSSTWHDEIVNENEWYMATFVVDPIDTKYYLNGQLKATFSTLTGSSTNGVNYSTLATDRNFANYFDGLLDDIRIYNRTLSDEEIERLYCPADATILGQGDTIIYQAASFQMDAACTKYPLTWTVNGSVVSNDSSLTLNASSIGTYKTILSSTDGFCTVTDTVTVRYLPDSTCLGSDAALKISDTQGNFLGVLDNSDLFGQGVSFYPDIDGNQINELLVGAPGDDDGTFGSTDRGAIYMIYLDQNGQATGHHKISSDSGGLGIGLINNDRFGTSIDNIGDLNNDGYDDIVVGVPGFDDVNTNCGGVFILFMDSAGQVIAEQRISNSFGNLNATLGPNGGFGTHVTAIGDINNDGNTDIAVGAPGANSGDGAVYILTLTTNGTVISETKIDRNSTGLSNLINTGDRFGQALTRIGDLNNDGISEFALGYGLYDGGGTERGAFLILSINSSLQISNPIRVTENENGFNHSLVNFGNFGSALAGLGDVDGDGYHELAVGNWRDNTGGSERGAVWVLSLDTSGYIFNTYKIDDNNSSTQLNLSNVDRFGRNISAIGDFNNDGVVDMAVGAREDDDGGSDRGAIYLIPIKDTCCPLVAQFNASALEVCKGNSLTFNNSSTSTSSGASYQWYVNDTLVASTQNLTYTFNSDGLIPVKLVVSDSCVRSYTEVITVHPNPIADAGTSQFICIGDTFQMGASGGVSYQWNNGASLSDDTISNPLAFPTTTTIYFVTVTDANGCTDIDDIALIVNPLPTITVSGDSFICAGDTAVLTATGGTSYNWSPSGSLINSAGPTVQATPDTATTYVVTVTDFNTCSDTAHYQVVIDTSLVASIASFTDASCYAGMDGTAVASATGGDFPFVFNWSSGSDSISADSLMAGQYTVTVTDTLGCTDTASVVIGEPDSISIAFSGSNVSCFGLSDGELIANPSGGTAGYSYNWSSGSTSNSSGQVAAGTYFVTVTDANNCQNIFSETVSQPDTLIASVSVDSNVSCFGGSDGAALASAIGGTQPYSFTWSNGVNFNQTSNLSEGTYTVTVIDFNGCSDTQSVYISEPTQLSATTTLDNDVSCFAGNDGAATANPSGGTSPYSYVWDNGETTQQADSLDQGTHVVTVTDAKGCSTTASILISEPAELFANASTFVNVSCFGLSDGKAFSAPAGGTTPYNYSWSSGSITDTAANLVIGTYTVTVTDNNGCVAIDSTSITQPDTLIAIIASFSDALCYNENSGTASASASGGTLGYTYLWSNNSNSATNTNLFSGVYSVTITDANGCSDSTSISIDEPNELMGTLYTSNPTCAGFSNGWASFSTIGGTPPYVLEWVDTQNFHPNSWQLIGTGDSIDNLDQGSYQLFVSDSNGCSWIEPFSLFEPQLLSSIIAVNNNVSCNGLSDGMATAQPNGGTPLYTYLWDNGETTQQADSLDAGTHVVTVTDSLGCTTTASIVITEPNVLAVNPGLNENVSCFGLSDGSLFAAPTGGTSPYSYNWSSGSAIDTASNLPIGTYTVTVTDANGCSAIDSATISQPDTLISSIASSSDALCFNDNSGSATATAMGGTTNYTYAWNNGATSATNSNLISGTYSVTITDANGCTDSSSVFIDHPTPLVSTTVVDSNVKCFNGSDGGAHVEVSGATPPYSYAWSNGDNDSILQNVSTGTYTVTITDSQGCVLVDDVFISEPTLLTASTTLDSNVTCFGYANGIATANPAGGTAPYTYLWDNGDMRQQADTLLAGTRSVTVTDSLGCQAFANVTISQPTAVMAILDSTKDVLCNGFYDGLAFTSAAGGTGPHSFSWNTGDTIDDIDSLTSGTYILTVYDSIGCFDTAAVTIIELSPIIPNVTWTNVSCFDGNDGDAASAPTGGGTMYDYIWSNGSTATALNTLTAQTYTLTVSDEYNCFGIDSAVVIEPDSIQFDFQITDITCTGDMDGAFDLTVSGGTPNYTYSWSNGLTIEDITALDSGTYAVTATDVNGCTNSDSAYIFEPSPISVSTQLLDSVDCNGNMTGDGIAFPQGGVANYSFLWSNGDTIDSLIDVASASYTITLTDSNGCTATNTIFIPEPAVLSLSIDSLRNARCKDEANAYLATTFTGGNGGNTYLWNNGDTTFDTDSLTDGTYSVTITDYRGCQDSVTATITEPDSLLMAITYTDTLVCQYDGDGELTASAMGGTLPYQFDWANGTTTAINNNLSDGFYAITITDENGCQDSANFTIDALSHIVSSVDSVYDILCFQDQSGFAKISADSGVVPYSYAWSNGSTADSIENVDGGTYFYTITDNRGCQDSGNLFIFEPTDLVLSIDTVGEVLCFGDDDGVIETSASGGIPGYTWNWSNSATTANINNLDSGMYTVTVTDTNGCFKVDSALIDEPAAPLSVTYNNIDANCLGGSNGTLNAIPAGGTAPYSAQWITGDTTFIVNLVPADTYSIVITDSHGCQLFDTTSIAEPVNPDTATIAKQNVTCFLDSNGTLTASFVNGTAPYNYTWNTGDTTALIDSLFPANYFVTVVDSFGCIQVASDSISQPDLLVASIAMTDTIRCFGDSTARLVSSAVGGTQPYAYSWSNTISGDVNDGLPIGTYDMLVTDSNGCTDSASFTVTEPPLLVIDSIELGDVSCFGLADAFGFVSANGGSQPYSYLWSDGGVNDTTNELSAGIQGVTVSDRFNCSADSSFTILQPDQLVASTFVNENANCDNSEDGSVYAEASGGNGGNAFLWTTGETNDTVQNLGYGFYTVTITDGLGCTDTSRVYLSFDNVQPDVFIGNDTTVCYTTSVRLEPQSDYSSYLWNTGHDTSTIFVTETGNYRLTVTDQYGCFGSDTVEIEKVFADSLNLGSDTVLCLDKGIFTWKVGATGFASYQWSDSTNSDELTIYQDGIYSLKAINEQGCISEDTIQVEFKLCHTPRVYPIPTENFITVEWVERPSSSINYVIIDMQGRISRQVELSPEQIHTIDMEQLRAGIYELYIYGDDFQTSVRIEKM